jgi:hypothetical protein
MAINFKIKYLPDIFENVDFITNRNFCDNSIRKVEPVAEKIMTKEAWASCNDIAVRERIKQATYKERWAIVIYSYEYADISLLQITESVELTLDNGDIWNISEFDVKIVNVQDQLRQIELSFTKDNNSTLSYPFLSDNISKKAASGWNYNRIHVVKNNPAYSQYVWFYHSFELYGHYRFKMRVDEITQNINVGEFYAVHPQNLDFQSIWLLTVFEVITKDAQFITFREIDGGGTPNNGNFYDTVIIDNIYNGIGSELILPKTLEFDIFTGLKEKNETEKKNGNEINTGDEIVILDQVTFSDYIRVPVFLRNSELWKSKYLSVANEIYYYFSGPSSEELIYQSAVNNNIITRQDVDYYDITEFEFKMLINQITMRNL